jgi:hypothetical protein
MAAHGGGGGGESAPASYGVPTATGGTGSGLFGGLSSILQGYQQERTLRGQEKQQKIENKQKSDEAAETSKMDTATITNMNLENVAAQATAARLAKQDATQTWQTQYDNVVKQAVKFPQITKDPVMMNQFLVAANGLGIPVVRNKDGSVNWDAMNPRQFSDLSVEDKAKFAALNPDDRNLQMQGIGGIPPRFLKVGAVLTPDEQSKRITALASGTRAATDATHKANIDRMNNTKLGFQDRLTAAKTAYTEAGTSTERDLALAKINELQAQAGKANAEAAAVGPRLQIEQDGLSLRAGTLRVAQDRLKHDTSKDAFTQLHSATTALDEYATRAQSELTAANAALTAYKEVKGNTIAPDDAMGQSLLKNAARLNDTLFTARQQADSARSAFVNYTHQGRAMTAQGGGKQHTIMPRKGAASGGTAEGTKATSKSGKPMVFQNGQWEYVK